MPFDLRAKSHTCIHVFQILNGNAPEYLNDMFQFAGYSHYSPGLGKLRSLKQLKTNTEFYQACVMYNRCKLWNSLPVTIRGATSKSDLKKSCIYFYFINE